MFRNLIAFIVNNYWDSQNIKKTRVMPGTLLSFIKVSDQDILFLSCLYCAAKPKH